MGSAAIRPLTRFEGGQRDRWFMATTSFGPPIFLSLHKSVVNGPAPMRAVAGADQGALHGVGAEQVRRGGLLRAGALFGSRGGLHKTSGRLQAMLETAGRSSGVFWGREVGVRRLLIFPKVGFVCGFG